jgi:hypothetical protein
MLLQAKLSFFVLILHHYKMYNSDESHDLPRQEEVAPDREEGMFPFTMLPPH